ncbi:hypothetical protein P3X46_009204 [Hevea brasiliensis]|uniref:Uncharacterized protein n=1 Tax=Hevea brasiliensis TaxID=3981 RepID=A0ABQ9MQ75_HEVBR|nr:hypothetical protein P3X46_009204 [Hevea brasiliensis]
MFIMSYLLEHRPLNLPILMIHTITMAFRYSSVCLLYGQVITRLLRALRVDPGAKATMTIPKDYGFYTMNNLPHMGLSVYAANYEHARRDRSTSAQRPQPQHTAATASFDQGGVALAIVRTSATAN